jgi:hypothetical protein
MRRAPWLTVLAARPVWATLLLIAIIAAYQLWGTLAASAKLAAAGLDDADDPVHVEVVVGIEPEQFHMFAFQRAGRLVEVDTPSVFLMDVPPARLRELASNYWVAEIRPWAGR